MQETAVDLRPLYRFLWQQKLFIGAVATVVTAIILLVTYLVAPVWRAKSVVLLPGSSDTSSLMTLALASDAADPLAILQGIVLSYPVQSRIMKEEKLGWLEIQDLLKVTTDGARQQLTLTVESPNQQQGLRILGIALEELERQSVRAEQEMAGRQFKAMEYTIRQKEQLVHKAQNALVAFQDRAITAPDPTAPFSGASYKKRLQEIDFERDSVEKQLRTGKDAAQRLASASIDFPTALQSNQRWREKIVQLEYDLRVAETKLGPEAPEVQSLQRQISETRKQAQEEISNELQAKQTNLTQDTADLEARRILLNFQRESLAKMAHVAPREATEMTRLIAEATMQGEILKTLRTQYEQEKAKSEIEKIKYSVLAPPYIEPLPTNKKYRIYGVLAFFLGGLIGAYIQSRRFYRLNGQGVTH